MFACDFRRAAHRFARSRHQLKQVADDELSSAPLVQYASPAVGLERYYLRMLEAVPVLPSRWRRWNLGMLDKATQQQGPQVVFPRYMKGNWRTLNLSVVADCETSR